MTVPQCAHAGDLPVAPNVLAQAGLAAAQNAVDAAAAAVSNANPAIAVPTVSGVAPAGTPAAPTRAAAAPAAAPVRTAPRPAVVTAGAAARAPRHSAPPAPPARAADPPLPVAVSAAHAGAVSATPVTRADTAPVVSVPAVPVVPAPAAVVPVRPRRRRTSPRCRCPRSLSRPRGLSASPRCPSRAFSAHGRKRGRRRGRESGLSSPLRLRPARPCRAAPGVPASTGWPLDLAAAPLSGAVPVPLNLPGAGVPFAHGALPGSAPLPRRRHPASGDRHGRAGRPHPGTRTRSDARGLRPVPAASWSGRAVQPALGRRRPWRRRPGGGDPGACAIPATAA